MKYYQEAVIFLESLINEAKSHGLEFPNNSIDHLCYRCSNLQNYQETKEEMQANGKLLVESIVGGRDIATYKLNQPIIFENQSVDIIEVPSPKKGSPYDDGFEHFEVVINESFSSFMNKYPHLNFSTKALNKDLNPDIKIQLQSGSIKFHQQSLEKVIEIELCRK